MHDAASRLDDLVMRAQHLCSLPAVAMKVLELTSNPHVNTHALKECIENDPALTGKILRVVNSSLFGLSREVSDLNQALALMGTKPLKLLVLGFSLPSGLFAGLSGEVLGLYWRRTLTKAVAARELSDTVWGQAGDEAFIAGLLQDLGVLLLIQELGDPYLKFVDRVYASGADLPMLETESLGFNHKQLSARLLTHWGLPDALVQAVAWEPGQQDPGAPEEPPALAAIVHLAELVAGLLLDGRPGALGAVLEAGRRYHDLTEAQLEALVATLEPKVRQLAEVLSLQLPDGMNYQDVLVRSQTQLAEIAAAAAGELVRHHVDREGTLQDEALLREIRLLSKAMGEASARPAPRPVPVAVAESAAREPAAVVIEPAARATEPDEVALDPGLVSRLEAAVAACRQSRCALSLLLVEIQHFDKLLVSHGPEAADRLRRLLEMLCRGLEHPGQTCLGYGEAGSALILPDCDRRQVVELGNQLIANVRRLSAARRGGLDQAFTLGVGAATVALPPKNFRAQDLVASAGRCLYGARTAGASVMKSIEIY